MRRLTWQQRARRLRDVAALAAVLVAVASMTFAFHWLVFHVPGTLADALWPHL